MVCANGVNKKESFTERPAAQLHQLDNCNSAIVFVLII